MSHQKMLFRTAAWAAAVICACLLCACDTPADRGRAQTVSRSDAASDVSDDEPAGVKDVVRLTVGDQNVEDIFPLQYQWYGEEYISEDSLNKLMMMQYASDERHPAAVTDGQTAVVTFDRREGIPSRVTLTRYANTFMAGTGIPYEIAEVALAADGGAEVSFTVRFDDFRLLYYVLDCAWDNGNTAQYAFALACGQ